MDISNVNMFQFRDECKTKTNTKEAEAEADKMIKRNLPKKKDLHFPKAIKGSQEIDGHEQKDTRKIQKTKDQQHFFLIQKINGKPFPT